MTTMRFLPMHPTSSRNGYSLDDWVTYTRTLNGDVGTERETTTLRALHEEGLLTVFDRMITKPRKRGETPVIETQYVASTLANAGPVQQWVITEEAYRELHPFNYVTEEDVVDVEA